MIEFIRYKIGELWRRTKGDPLKIVRELWRRLYTVVFRYPSRVRGGMQSVTIIVESRCNLSCRMCSYHSKESTRPKTNFTITQEEFKSVFDVLYDNGLQFCHLCGIGEPFANSDIFKMIRYAKEKGLYTSVLSNGSKIISDKIESIAESGLDTFMVDLDSPDPEEFEYIKRGISFDDVMNNLRHLTKLRTERAQKMRVGAWAIVMKSNYRKMRRLIEISADIGLDMLMYSYLVPVKSLDPLISEKNVIGENDAEAFDYLNDTVEYGRKLGVKVGVPDSFRMGFYDKNVMCKSPWYGLMVNLPSPSLPREEWLGNLSMHCTLADTDYGRSFGNILKQPFDDVWNGSGLTDLRRRLSKGVDVPAVCMHGCPQYRRNGASVDQEFTSKTDAWYSG